MDMKTENQSTNNFDKFLNTFSQILAIARWFGISVFRESKVAMLWSFIILCLLLAIEIGAIWKVIKFLAGWAAYTTGARGIVGRLSGAIFYGNGLISLVLSLRLIYSWKALAVHWSLAENSGLYVPGDRSIRRRVILVSTFVGVCATVEHLLSMISSIGLDCPADEILERYILDSHGFLLVPEDYNLWVAIPVFFVSKIATILWNFQDLIIILISMGLSSRYNRLNLCVKRLIMLEQQMDSKYADTNIMKLGTEVYMQVQKWRKIREAYVKQASVVRMVDSIIGPMILLSNLNNFYFICLQLFFGINKMDRAIASRLYYMLSLGWLLFRACYVVLAAAEVNLNSRRALRYLHICPSFAYNVEVKRLKNQLTNDFVALSGMGFFWLDRQILLVVAAAIVKYELVLLQYDG